MNKYYMFNLNISYGLRGSGTGLGWYVFNRWLRISSQLVLVLDITPESSDELHKSPRP